MNIIEQGKIDPKQIWKVSDNNVRKTKVDRELDDLIRSVRTLQKVTTPVIINESNEVVCGQRRWKAAKEAGLKEIPYIRKHYDSEMEEVYDSFIENEQHLPLEPVDKGRAIKKLRTEFDETYPVIANKIGIHSEFLSRLEGKVGYSEIQSQTSEGGTTETGTQAQFGGEGSESSGITGPGSPSLETFGEEPSIRGQTIGEMPKVNLPKEIILEVEKRIEKAEMTWSKYILGLIKEDLGLD